MLDYNLYYLLKLRCFAYLPIFLGRFVFPFHRLWVSRTIKFLSLKLLFEKLGGIAYHDRFRFLRVFPLINPKSKSIKILNKILNLRKSWRTFDFMQKLLLSYKIMKIATKLTFKGGIVFLGTMWWILFFWRIKNSLWFLNLLHRRT